MDLSPMRYKSYTWPHNPRIYSIDFQRAMAVHKTPFGRYQLQDLGLGHRVMKGSGEFAGKGAYEEFQRLACLFYEGGTGLLVHPLWQAADAYFVALRLEQTPRPDYVRYSFEFWEEVGRYRGVADRAAADALQPAAGEPALSSSASASPASGSSAPASSGQADYHRVVKGDTLWGLSRRYGVELKKLIALNPQIKNPNLIYVGQEVRIR